MLEGTCSPPCIFFYQVNSHGSRASYLSDVQELDREIRIELGGIVDALLRLSDSRIPV